jgi:hypothetical protein
VLLVVLCILRNWFQCPARSQATDEWQNFRSDKRKWTEATSDYIQKIVVDVIGKLSDNDAVRQDIGALVDIAPPERYGIAR